MGTVAFSTSLRDQPSRFADYFLCFRRSGGIVRRARFPRRSCDRVFLRRSCALISDLQDRYWYVYSLQIVVSMVNTIAAERSPLLKPLLENKLKTTFLGFVTCIKSCTVFVVVFSSSFRSFKTNR